MKQNTDFLHYRHLNFSKLLSCRLKMDAAEKKKVCNWCKKHGYPCKGHLWFQCRRLKEEQAKRKKQKEKDQKDQKGKGKADKDIKPESAHVSTEVEPKPSAGTDQPSAGTDVALTAVSAHHKHQND